MPNIIRRALPALAVLALPLAARADEAKLVLPDLASVQFLGMSGRSLLLTGLVVCALGLAFGIRIFAQLQGQKDDKGKAIYPPSLNWDVVTQAIPFSDVNPNFEAPMPNYNKSLDVLVKYLTRFTGTKGLDIDAELTKMKTELQAVFDKAS